MQRKVASGKLVLLLGALAIAAFAARCTLLAEFIRHNVGSGTVGGALGIILGGVASWLYVERSRKFASLAFWLCFCGLSGLAGNLLVLVELPHLPPVSLQFVAAACFVCLSQAILFSFILLGADLVFYKGEQRAAALENKSSGDHSADKPKG